MEKAFTNDWQELKSHCNITNQWLPNTQHLTIILFKKNTTNIKLHLNWNLYLLDIICKYMANTFKIYLCPKVY